MGLDIVAYGGLKPDPKGDFQFDPGLGSEYRVRADDLKEGSYSFEKDFHFRAGSYGGYNEWRDELAFVAGFSGAKDVWGGNKPGAFTELINFSDCEGVIGPAVCKKLYADFVNEQFIDAAREKGDWFWDKYKQWTEAFRVASDNGAVVFC